MTLVGSTTNTHGVRLPEKGRSFADKAELAWIGSIVFYSIARFAIAWGGFSEHGANPWIFGVIDVGTAYPYAKATATLVRRGGQSEWSRMGLALATAVVTFFAPYVYLWFAAGSMPDGLRLGMITFVSVFLIAAVAVQTIKIRKLRAKHAQQHAQRDLRAAGPETELVIDLRGDKVKIERAITTP